MKAYEIALQFKGQHEGKNNTFDSSTPLGAALLSVGHKNGDPWCARFVLYCVKSSDGDDPRLDKLVTPSAVTSFTNLKKVLKYSAEPIYGKQYIVAWQSYKNGVAQWTGHIGLVEPTKINNTKKTFVSVEGNAAELGVTREGVQVAEVAHSYDTLAYKVDNGLRLLGFIEI